MFFIPEGTTENLCMVILILLFYFIDVETETEEYWVIYQDWIILVDFAKSNKATH